MRASSPERHGLFPHASQLRQYSLAGLGGIDAQFPESLRAEVPAWVTLRRPDQAEQQVLGADVAVAQSPGFPGGSSTDCFASRVIAILPVPWAGPGDRSSAPGPKLSSTLRAISSRSMPMLASASASSPPGGRRSGAARPSLRSIATASTPRPARARAATPSPHASACSRYTGRIWSPRSAASALAAITAVLALSVNRSNIGIPSGSVGAGAAGVLLVDRLPGHAEDFRDLLPGPAVFPGVVDLERLRLPQQP